MILLDWISLISVVLAGSALTAMVGLILRRYWQNRREHLDAARSAWLTNLALEYLEEPAKTSELKAQLVPRDRHLLVRLMSDLLPKVRGEYAARIVDLMRELGVVDECLEALHGHRWWERAEACTALSSFNESRVVGALEALLDDPQTEVRVAAARALGKLGAPPPVFTLVNSLAIGRQARSLAINDIFRSLGPQAAADLIAVLESDAPHPAKLFAIEALGHIGDLSAVPTLLKLCQHPLSRVRAAVVRALGMLADPRALSAVMKALGDPAWEVRSQAASSAGQLGAQEALPVLERRLDDEQWWVRYHAADALFKLGADGLKTLHAAAQGPLVRAAEIAQGFLREKGMAA